jgi:hypothetical protein
VWCGGTWEAPLEDSKIVPFPWLKTGYLASHDGDMSTLLSSLYGGASRVGRKRSLAQHACKSVALVAAQPQQMFVLVSKSATFITIDQASPVWREAQNI